jgi:hypothetical protein
MMRLRLQATVNLAQHQVSMSESHDQSARVPHAERNLEHLSMDSQCKNTLGRLRAFAAEYALAPPGVLGPQGHGARGVWEYCMRMDSTCGLKLWSTAAVLCSCCSARV